MTIGLTVRINDKCCSMMENISECPQGWTAFSSSCYRHINSPHTWPEALAVCNALGFTKINCPAKYVDWLVQEPVWSTWNPEKSRPSSPPCWPVTPGQEVRRREEGGGGMAGPPGPGQTGRQHRRWATTMLKVRSCQRGCQSQTCDHLK